MSERTMRRKAFEIGYELQKGYRCYLMGGGQPVLDEAGNKISGYNIRCMSNNTLVHGCYNNICDHLYDLDDVKGFLKEEYESAGLVF